MRLLLMSVVAMIASTICLSAIFLNALYTPTRPALGVWTTSVTYADNRVKHSALGNQTKLLAINSDAR